MAAFKAGKKDILIATDVAARGIDVNDVTHVINHTMPDDPDTYLHRAGRTGRAGKTGIAVTFVDWDDLHKWGAHPPRSAVRAAGAGRDLLVVAAPVQRPRHPAGGQGPPEAVVDRARAARPHRGIDRGALARRARRLGLGRRRLAAPAAAHPRRLGLVGQFGYRARRRQARPPRSRRRGPRRHSTDSPSSHPSPHRRFERRRRHAARRLNGKSAPPSTWDTLRFVVSKRRHLMRHPRSAVVLSAVALVIALTGCSAHPAGSTPHPRRPGPTRRRRPAPSAPGN